MDDVFARWSGSLPERRLPPASATEEAHWSDRFHDMDRYDWDDPAWKKQNAGPFGIVPIALRSTEHGESGYFMTVFRKDYESMTKYPDGSPKLWHAKFDLEKQTGEIAAIYARRHGRRGEPGTVYAHREICRCLHVPELWVDHVNGLTLDNRGYRGGPGEEEWVNLKPGPASANGTNKSFTGLMTGVVTYERKDRNGKKRTVYIGQRCKRLDDGKVKTIRTKRKYLTPESAHRWYQNQLKKIHKGRGVWAFNPISVSWPTFPPRMDLEPVAAAPKRAARTKVERELAEIPF